MSAARVEEKICRFITARDTSHSSRCVRFHDAFRVWARRERREFYCLVFEKLGISLYDLIKKNEYMGRMI